MVDCEGKREAEESYRSAARWRKYRRSFNAVNRFFAYVTNSDSPFTFFTYCS